MVSQRVRLFGGGLHRSEAGLGPVDDFAEASDAGVEGGE
jgi:hypothetical protein